MKKQMKKVLVFVLMMAMFIGMPSERVEARPKKAQKQATRQTKKKKAGIRFKKSLVKDFGIGFGEINKKNGGGLEGELLYHGEFAVPMEKLELFYIFTDYDGLGDYELTDDLPMNKIQGRIDRMVSGMKKEVTVKDFVKSMKKGLFNVKAEILDGEQTSYYIAERYAEFTFGLKKGGETKYCLQIALDEKDKIFPDSLAWLTEQTVQ